MKIRQEIVIMIYCYYTVSFIIRNCQRKLSKLSKENTQNCGTTAKETNKQNGKIMEKTN